MADKLVLTDEQRAMLPGIRDEWIARCLEPRRGDREKGVEALRAAYVEANLKPPRVCLWSEDPVHAVYISGSLTVDKHPFREQALRVLALMDALDRGDLDEALVGLLHPKGPGAATGAAGAGAKKKKAKFKKS